MKSMYQYDQKPRTAFTPEATRLIGEIKKNAYSVLCGRNNCGKSFLLKTLKKSLGEKAAYLGPARYQNFNLLGHYAPSKNKRSEEFNQWLSQFENQAQNIDNSPWNLQQAIAELSDNKRIQLAEIMENLLGSKMDILHTITDNSMSQKYISVGGHNISYTSSGYRLIATLVTSLLSEEFDYFLIDEPELGISPEAQGVFSDFLFDPEIRKRYFGHVKSLVVATHSTIFLDRENLENNYFVEKNGDNIDLRKVKSVADINRIHFFLLGNRLESLYMPSAIVIVEGKSDYKYIERVLQTRFDGIRFSIIPANSDSRIREVFSITKGLFGDIQKSPYHGRVFAVIDSIHGVGLVQHLEKMGVPKDNIIVWSKNGIEYYYPPEIMKTIFQSSGDFAISGDQITLNGLVYSKNDLCDLVLPKVDARTQYCQEFNDEFLAKIEKATGATISGTVAAADSAVTT